MLCFIYSLLLLFLKYVMFVSDDDAVTATCIVTINLVKFLQPRWKLDLIPNICQQLSVARHVTLVVFWYHKLCVLVLVPPRGFDFRPWPQQQQRQHHMSWILLLMLISFISCLLLAAVLAALMSGLHVRHRVQSCRLPSFGSDSVSEFLCPVGQ